MLMQCSSAHTQTHSQETQYILYIDKLQLILGNEDLLILLLKNEEKKTRNKTEKWIWLELWRESLYLAFRFLRLGIKILWMQQPQSKLYLFKTSPWKNEEMIHVRGGI